MRIAHYVKYNTQNSRVLVRGLLPRPLCLGLVVKASASRAADLGLIPAFTLNRFPGQVIPVTKKNWSFSSYPVRHLSLQGQHWDWPTWCQYMVIGWDSKFDLQLLSQCGSSYKCLSRSVPEIHWHVAGTLCNQLTATSPISQTFLLQPKVLVVRGVFVGVCVRFYCDSWAWKM